MQRRGLSAGRPLTLVNSFRACQAAAGFATFTLATAFLETVVRLKQSDEIQAKLDEAGLDLMEYGDNGRYRIRVGRGDVQKHEMLLKELLQKAYAESGGVSSTG